MPISPYAAMYPYMQQDPSAFYAAASPYNQPMMLVPQGDYRNAPPALHHAPSPYRNVNNLSPYAPPNPGLSPYGSPGPLRTLDIGKDFGGMNLGGLSLDEGVRSKPSSSTSAPFGGMFGSIPSFETGSGRANSGAAAFAQQNVSAPSKPEGYGSSRPTGAVAARSGSFDSGDKAVTASVPSSGREREDSTTTRPPALHSRSSSLLYHSGKASSGTANS